MNDFRKNCFKKEKRYIILETKILHRLFETKILLKHDILLGKFKWKKTLSKEDFCDV